VGDVARRASAARAARPTSVAAATGAARVAPRVAVGAPARRLSPVLGLAVAQSAPTHVAAAPARVAAPAPTPARVLGVARVVVRVPPLGDVLELVRPLLPALAVVVARVRRAAGRRAVLVKLAPPLIVGRDRPGADPARATRHVENALQLLADLVEHADGGLPGRRDRVGRGGADAFEARTGDGRVEGRGRGHGDGRRRRPRRGRLLRRLRHAQLLLPALQLGRRDAVLHHGAELALGARAAPVEGARRRQVFGAAPRNAADVVVLLVILLSHNAALTSSEILQTA